MGEEIAEGEWDRFAELDRQIESTAAALKRGALESEPAEK